MANLTIKYGDETLAEVGGTVNKTLKTAGKYCESNFIVEMVEGESAVSYKYYTVDVAEKVSGGWTTLVEADADIAAHRGDETFGIAWNCLSAVQAAASTRGGLYTNAPMAFNTSDGTENQYGYYMRTGSTGLGANARLANTLLEKTTAAGACYVSEDGAVEFYASSSYPILAGTYQIVIWW